MADTDITITLTTAGHCWSDHPRQELSRILRTIADRIDGGHFATFTDLPESLFDCNGNRTGGIEVTLDPSRPGSQGDLTRLCWADLLGHLPVLQEGHTSDLYVDAQGVRVWLARTAPEDGEPFRRTVYVEEHDDDQGEWWEVGYFDGDEPAPKPAGVLGEAYDVTLDCVREAEAQG